MDAVLKDTYEADAKRQVIGNTRPLVDGGQAFSGNNVLVFGEPILRTGRLLEMNIYSAASKELIIKRFTKSGNDFTQVGSDYPFNVTTGLQKYSRSHFGHIAVVAGEYLGIFSTTGSPLSRAPISAG